MTLSKAVFGHKVTILPLTFNYFLYFHLLMKYKNLIANKVKYYDDFINHNNITDQLIDPVKRSKYSIHNYLYMYFLFQKSNLSYDIFYEIFDYAVSIGSNNYPKRTALHTFKVKLSKLKLHKKIHEKNIINYNLITNVCSIDSVIIPNKCNSLLSGTYNYKNKKGSKVSHLVNEVL